MASRRKKALASRITRAGIYLFLVILFGFLAFGLFDLSTPQRAKGDDVTPDMLLLTSERKISVNIDISYFQWYQSSPEGLGFGPSSGSLPTGSREIQVQFYGGKPHSLLQYSILLGRNGDEINPIGQQRERIYSGIPGGTSSSDCVSPQTAGIVQVLYGTVRLGPQGAGTIETVGALKNQHAYLANGSSDVVGVVAINSPITDIASSGPGGTCIFPDWPYLGGTLWFSPGSLGGKVVIGQVGNSFSVDSVNPSLVDLSSLSWQINGPTSISYTLTNNGIAHRQLIESFGAGVIAAVAAAFFVEFAKIAIGEGRASNMAGDKTPAKNVRNTGPAENHPKIARIVILVTFVEAIRKRRHL